ncbi:MULTISPECIES: hypothetical protein [unclassified Kosakonia]|uniref:hypothetical protein n=1 Tax=unclassified Kosakonia TaxID=2632876 RepID=UPI0031B679F0
MTAATPAMLVSKPFKNMLALFDSLPTGYLFIRLEVPVLNGTARATAKSLQTTSIKKATPHRSGILPAQSKLTSQPRSFIESGVDSHSALAARKQKSRRSGFLPEQSTLTGKPRSFIESGVDSHSALAARKQKSRRSGFLSEQSKLTSQPRSFIENGADSHSALAARKQKPRRSGVLSIVETGR